MNLQVSTKLRALVMPHDPRITTVIPHAKIYTKNGMYYHVVPHGTNEVKVLSNLGYNPPAPILSQYNWCNTTPYAHQETTSALLSTSFRAYVLNGLGSGKTRSALFAADYLMNQGEIRKALIIAPLSTLSATWEREIFQVMPHRTSTVLHGTKVKRLKNLGEDVDFYVINTDGLSVITDALMERGDIDLFIIDEIAMFRNKRTRRWKMLNKLVSHRKYAWGMTGLPTPNGPTDAWAQCKLLTPERVPKYFKQFQHMVEYQVSQFRWLPKDEANDVVFDAMQPAVRFATDACIDLPPTTYSVREAIMSSEQATAYKQMVDNFYTQYQGEEITAANEGVKLSKLLQIACGFSYTNNTHVNFPMANRINVLKEILEETEQKVIVFAPFKHTVDTLYTLLSKYYSVEKIYGDTPKKERDAIFNMFNNSLHPKILVAHPGVMSHGLTLVAANVIVWFSPTTSYETRDQANARIIRPGQKHHTHIIDVVATPVEQRMLKRLDNKQKMQGVLLDMFADMY